MNNLQTAIIYASIIGTILSEFETSNKTITILKKRIKKFMFSRSRTNKKDFLEAVRKGEEVWGDAINHFAKEKISIDAFSTIIAVWSSQAELLARMVNLSEKRVEKFSMLNSNDRLDAELNGYKVAEYITGSISNGADSKKES